MSGHETLTSLTPVIVVDSQLGAVGLSVLVLYCTSGGHLPHECLLLCTFLRFLMAVNESGVVSPRVSMFKARWAYRMLSAASPVTLWCHIQNCSPATADEMLSYPSTGFDDRGIFLAKKYWYVGFGDKSEYEFVMNSNSFFFYSCPWHSLVVISVNRELTHPVILNSAKIKMISNFCEHLHQTKPEMLMDHSENVWWIKV